jgi:hypothetical protein
VKPTIEEWKTFGGVVAGLDRLANLQAEGYRRIKEIVARHSTLLEEDFERAMTEHPAVLDELRVLRKALRIPADAMTRFSVSEDVTKTLYPELADAMTALEASLRKGRN